MATIRFKIGEGFPAADPVARFIAVAAMVSNDGLRLLSEMVALDEADPDVEGRRLMLFRQQAALHHEAARFIRDARGRFPEVDGFITGLAPAAQDEYRQVTGVIDSTSEHDLGDWLGDHRNVSFHYPVMHPERAAAGQEEISKALEAARELEGTISMDEAFGGVRFGFADDVAVQRLPDPETKAHLIEQLRDSVMALMRFVQRASQAYLESRAEGTFTVDS